MTAVGIAVLTAVFGLVFVCRLPALAASGMFGPGSRFFVAACTATLSVLGLLDLIPGHRGSTREPVACGIGIGGLLLPYAALAIALVVLLLGLAIGKALKWLPKSLRDTGRCPDRVSRQDAAPERTITRNSEAKHDTRPGLVGRGPKR